MTGPDKDAAPERGQDDPLAPFFSAARAAAPPPSDTLMARIAQDAARLQPRPATAPVPVRTRAAQRLHAALARLSGGWGRARALAGAGAIAATAVAGVVLGVVLGVTAPGPLALLEAEVWGDDALAALDAELAFLLAELDSAADTFDPTPGGSQ